MNKCNWVSYGWIRVVHISALKSTKAFVIEMRVESQTNKRTATDRRAWTSDRTRTVPHFHFASLNCPTDDSSHIANKITIIAHCLRYISHKRRFGSLLYLGYQVSEML